MNSTSSRHLSGPPSLWRRTWPLRWLLILGALGWLVHSLGLLEQLGIGGKGTQGFFMAQPHPEMPVYTRLAVGVPMAERFTSYQDVDSSLRALAEAGHASPSRSFRKAADSSKYPPYRFDTVRVEGYSHLGQPGRLSLEFFNDRLFQVEFAPDDAVDYARQQAALGLARDRNARREKVEGDLRIASTVDLAVSQVGRHLGTKPFVLWQDLRLIEQRDQWDEKFGAIPKKMAAG